MRSILLTFLLCAVASLQAADKLKVLIVDGQNNHKWDITTPVLRNALESSGAFTVDVSTTPPKGAPKDAWHAWKPVFSATVSKERRAKSPCDGGCAAIAEPLTSWLLRGVWMIEHMF